MSKRRYEPIMDIEFPSVNDLKRNKDRYIKCHLYSKVKQYMEEYLLKEIVRAMHEGYKGIKICLEDLYSDVYCLVDLEARSILFEELRKLGYKADIISETEIITDKRRKDKEIMHNYFVLSWEDEK